MKSKDKTVGNKYDGAWLSPHFNMYLEFFDNPKYKKLSPLDIMLYGFLVNQWTLSEETTRKGIKTYVDAEGDVYCVMDQRKMALLLKVSPRTISSMVKRLEKAGLITNERDYVGAPNRIYVHKFEVTIDTNRFYHPDPAKYKKSKTPANVADASDTSANFADTYANIADVHTQNLQMPYAKFADVHTQNLQSNYIKDNKINKQQQQLIQGSSAIATDTVADAPFAAAADISFVSSASPNVGISDATSVVSPTSAPATPDKREGGTAGASASDPTVDVTPTPSHTSSPSGSGARASKPRRTSHGKKAKVPAPGSAAATMDPQQQAGLLQCLHDEFGVGVATGKIWMATYPLNYLNNNMETVYAMPDVQNRGGALRRALEQDWYADSEAARQRALVEASRVDNSNNDNVPSLW